MEYKFFLLSADDAKDPSKTGWAYALYNKNQWISAPSGDTSFLTVGYNRGSDFVVRNNVAYMIYKSFIDISSGVFLLLCVESEFGCDVKSFN